MCCYCGISASIYDNGNAERIGILFDRNKLIYLVIVDVSRETSMPAVNWLTQIGNERMSVIDRHVLYAATLSGDCLLPARLPDQKGVGHRHLLVCLLHFGLRPVRLDRLRICPFQSRQWQQNISLTCAYKASLSFAKIPNCGGHFCRLSKSWQTKSD